LVTAGRLRRVARRLGPQKRSRVLRNQPERPKALVEPSIPDYYGATDNLLGIDGNEAAYVGSCRSGHRWVVASDR
jgi:hypothetical protein